MKGYLMSQLVLGSIKRKWKFEQGQGFKKMAPRDWRDLMRLKIHPNDQARKKRK